MTSLTFPLHHLHDPEVYIAQAKSQRRANTLVFGLLPLNRLAPDNPGRINHSDRGSSSTSDTKSANRPTEGCKTGQKGPAIGGHHQLFSPAQLTVKASTASAPGFQYRLLNLKCLSVMKIGKPINCIGSLCKHCGV